MELLRFCDLECHYGAREIFANVSGRLAEGERVGLVGPNGAGKSSLLRLLAGVESPFGGTIVRARGVRFGYLGQSVADETTATLAELIAGALERAPHEERGLRNKTLRILLAAFGFDDGDLERSLRTFSGGQRAKAALAHVLIDDPEYCILDEPTNHLDISTVRWLETYIANDKRAYLLVSHDRYFLDRVATRIWELDRGTLDVYPEATPAYAAFIAAREDRRERARREFDAYLAERDKARATVAGLRATLTSSNYSQVRSREKHLDRIESQQPPPPAPQRRAISVDLPASRRDGNGFAFEARALTKRYDRTLFENLTIDVERGERIAVVGANGSGKSTLLKILAGDVVADAGAVRFNVASQVASFAQNAHEELAGAQNAVDAVKRAGYVTDERARGLLGRMRISGDEGDKPIHAFSGGERRRIMLACLMARAADILLLDEPTNDLDVESREALESVLAEYEGTIVAVSHDRYFLNALCDRVLWIEDGSWGILDGGYEAYEAQARERERVKIEARVLPKREKTSTLTPLKMRSKLETQVARLEREIEKLDARKAEIDALFSDPAFYDNRARVNELAAEREAVTARSAQAVTEWEARLLELEELDYANDGLQRRGSDQAVARYERSEFAFAVRFRSRRPHRQDHVPRFGRAIPNGDPRLRRQRQSELFEHLARFAYGARAILQTLVPAGRWTEQRDRITRTQRANDEIVILAGVFDDAQFTSAHWVRSIPIERIAAFASSSKRALNSRSVQARATIA